MRRYPLLLASLLAACPSTSPVSIPCRSSDDCPTGWGCGSGGVCQQGIAGSYGGGCLADAGLTACDGGLVTYCANLSNDPNDCGGCGVVCPAGELCVAGACAASCLTGQTLCGADGGAAYCASLAGDSNNCGGCGRVCAAGQRCVAGACTSSCPIGQTPCQGRDAGVFYCATLGGDSSNCGGCGQVCPAGELCAAGACAPSCLAGQAPCGGADGGAPYCATLGSDSSNCGGCGNACSAGLRCNGAGECTGSCAGGTTLCTPDGGAPRCADLSSDSIDCGSCGHACPTGESCARGACAPSCLAGETFCNGLCTDTSTDTRNCGGCAVVPSDGGIPDGGAADGGFADGGFSDAGVPDGGGPSVGVACVPGEACLAGRCTPSCLPTETLCNGLCTDTNTDPLNCGNCNNPCPSGQTCNGAGLCVESCAAGLTPCSGSAGGAPYCANLPSDNANCGVCGTACGSGASCCSGSCVNFATDPANCGGCGKVCTAPTPYCAGASCTDLYTFTGIQTNLPAASLAGWTLCYQDTYNISISTATVLSDCASGGQLLLACAPVGASTLTVAAEGARSDVTFVTNNTACGQNQEHVANGVAWWFDTAWSWGFAPPGDAVSLCNCDTDTTPDDGLRLCWHTNTAGGYRCGSNVGLNGSTTWARYVYQAP
ncbi:MAG: hypothetical protein ACYDCL_14135 [Myxococcales bacterium]